MIVVGFDGKLHKFNYLKNKSRKHRSGKSSLHISARELLVEIFPNQRFYEEVTLPGSKKNGKGLLYADFFLPNKMIIVEVHGKQHYEYTSLFHKSKLDFLKYKNRDKIKKEWCDLNNIMYIELKYNERELWKSQILLMSQHT
jgi:hypothetical protein